MTSTALTTRIKGCTNDVGPTCCGTSHQLKEQYPQHQGLAEWAREVREVYDHAQAYPGLDPQLPETVQQSQRVKQQQYQQ